MRRAVTIVLLAVPLAATGCAGQKTTSVDSTKDFSGAEKQVAATIEQLQSSTKDRDGARICRDLLTAKLQQSIAAHAGARGCAQAVKDAIRDTDQVDLIVKKVELSSSTARATVAEETSKDRTRTRTVLLEKQGPRWRISELPAA